MNSELIKSIYFPDDSEINTFEKDSFAYSSLESICIPSSVTFLNEGCFKGTSKLNNVSVMPQNKRYSYFDEKVIIAKCDINANEYDSILFARRDIKKIAIPSFIKHILKYSFAESSIEQIYIPFQVTDICKGAFFGCKQLQEVDISDYSELITIGKFAFSQTSIERFTIPASLKYIEDYAFYKCKLLKIIEFPQESDIKMIGKSSFVDTNIEKSTIPSHVFESTDFKDENHEDKFQEDEVQKVEEQEDEQQETDAQNSENTETMNNDMILLNEIRKYLKIMITTNQMIKQKPRMIQSASKKEKILSNGRILPIY